MDLPKYNVCLLNDSFPPLIDGVANAVINYAETIQSELGSATVVTPSYPDYEDRFEFPVIRYSSMDTSKYIGYRAGYPFSSSVLSGLKESKFDIIHSHCPFASTILGRTLREKSNAPLIMTYHTKFDEDIKRIVENPYVVSQITKFVVHSMDSCDEIWTVSKGAGENLHSLGYVGNYIVMPNGVDFPKGKANADDTSSLKKELGLSDSIPKFLFVGRLFWYKGLKLIFDSLCKLKNDNIDFRFIIVGDGGDKAEMEQYAKEIGVYDKCIFTGAVSDREKLRCFYTVCDLFLFPSLYDTNGIVVREAAACGLPSILIKGSCAAEDFTHYRNAILSENETESFTAELKYASSHLNELKLMGENAMNEVYISWNDAVKNAYKRYNIVSENKKRGVSQCRENKFQEAWYSYISDTTDLIQNVRSITAETRHKREMFSQAIKLKSKSLTENITSNFKDLTDKNK